MFQIHNFICLNGNIHWHSNDGFPLNNVSKKIDVNACHWQWPIASICAMFAYVFFGVHGLFKNHFKVRDLPSEGEKIALKNVLFEAWRISS